MNHPDEGTIHAWLDGALDVAMARDIEGHVDDCLTCAERVAEARGLIAGASRILTSLDDVPARVTPKRAPVAKRQWRAAPWVTGIAATLILAIGITTWRREPMATMPAPAGTEDRGAAAAGSTAPIVAPTTAQRLPVSPTPMPARRDAALRSVVRQEPAIAAASGAGVGESRDLAGRGVTAPQARPSAARAELAAAAEPTQEMAKKAVSEAEPSAPAVPLAGCYRLEKADGRGGIAAPIDAAAVASAASRAIAPAPGAPVQRQAEFVSPELPAVVRLDTAKIPVGYVARSAATGAVVGSWSRVYGDSVRVDLQRVGLFTISGSKRVTCPQP